MHPTLDPSWNLYPETLVHFVDRELSLDLRFPVSREQVARLREFGLAAPFVIITAENPFGMPATPDENDLNCRALVSALEARGVPFHRCDGTDPALVHRERGFAVALPTAEATNIAKDLGQSAFFYFDGMYFWVMPAAVNAQPIRLPLGA